MVKYQPLHVAQPHATDVFIGFPSASAARMSALGRGGGGSSSVTFQVCPQRLGQSLVLGRPSINTEWMGGMSLCVGFKRGWEATKKQTLGHRGHTGGDQRGGAGGRGETGDGG